jgi:hypothetical protein
MDDEEKKLEVSACTPIPISPKDFNPAAVIPYGLTVEHIRLAMTEFIDFLGFINTQLFTREIPRLEAMLMQANFSSMVGEFMSAAIPKYCSTIVKNQYHNGHPDLVPPGIYPGDAVLHGSEGIEIKGSRYVRGWQGHNAEDVWLLVFTFDSSTPRDKANRIAPKPFRFRLVAGAAIEKADWTFSGRTGASRRTPTASVNPSGYSKMLANWIYKEPATTTATLLASLPETDAEPPASE